MQLTRPLRFFWETAKLHDIDLWDWSDKERVGR